MSRRKKATKDLEEDSTEATTPGTVTEEENSDISKKIDMLIHMQQAQDSKISQILSKIGSLENKWSEVMKELGEHKKALESQDCEITELKKSLNDYAPKKELENLKRNLVDLENRSRRNNLIFWNVPEHAEDTYASCANFIESFVKDHMKCTEIQGFIVERAHRTQMKNSDQRPIHAKIVNWSHKEKIIKMAAKLLKDNPFLGKKIFISDDVSVEVRQDRARLKPHLEKLRSSEDVLFAYIPWSVPARIVYKQNDGKFNSLFASKLTG